ncbi:MAG: RNA polymerase sigma factor [Pseudomonadota bacterium]
MRKNSAKVAVGAGLPEVYPRLWRFCLVLCKDRALADDLAQSTCARALEKANQFTPGTHLDRWLFTMARRIWLNEQRAGKIRQGRGLVPVEDADIPDHSSGPETNILAREVFTMIEALPEGQRITALLVYVEGQSYREAAEILDIPIGTVMSRLSTVRKTINGQMTRTKDEG